jgi:hypothetical protein
MHQLGSNPVQVAPDNPSPTWAELMSLGERELAVFIRAVTESFGPEQGQLAANGWLEELSLIEMPLVSPGREWRWVTVAACARLASRTRSGK